MSPPPGCGGTLFDCPVCNKPLVSQPGNQLSATDGVTVFCPHNECPAQEVFGHGDNEKQAFKVIQQKFTNERE